MSLIRVRAVGVRNLADVDLRPGPGLTIFHGPNASGKTSLLEAIHILSCGKSFRVTQLQKVVGHGRRGLLVAGELGAEGPKTSFGLEFRAAGSALRMRRAGHDVQRLSEFATTLPLVAIHQDSDRLISGGPTYRRQFLDWGLFHVEPRFMPAWQRYRRAMRQRNALLQGGRLEGLSAWDAELATTGEDIDAMRRDMVARLSGSMADVLTLLGLDWEVSLHYRPGWREDLPLRRALAETLDRDRAAGYGRVGPHRADVEFRRDQRLVRDVLSRGQVKTLVSAAHLAQAMMFQAVTGRSVVVLVDDLISELDDAHASCLLRSLEALGMQTFVAGAENRLLQLATPHRPVVFHVEHGQVTEVV